MMVFTITTCTLGIILYTWNDQGVVVICINNTVNMERFAGLNFHALDPTNEVFHRKTFVVPHLKQHHYVKLVLILEENLSW